MVGRRNFNGTLILLVLAFGLAAGWACVGASAEGEKPAQADKPQLPESKEKAEGGAKKSSLNDQYGDPLPEGAVLRLGTVRLRHNEQVDGVAYSPDGKILASRGVDEAIHLWDASTGKPIRELSNPHGASCIAFSPDGSKLASGSGQSVRLWDVRSGKMVFEKQGHVQDVSGVAFAPDGLSFASVGDNIQVWNALTGVEILSLQPVRGRDVVEYKQGLGFSPDGKLLAASRGLDIHVWDTATGASRLIIPKAYSRDVIFTIFHDNNTLISSEWGYVRFWDVTTGKQIREFNPKGTNYGASIALSGNGKLLAMAALEKIDILDVSTGKTVQVLSDYYNSHGPSTNHLAFSPDASFLAARAGDNVVRVWDIATGKRQLAFDDSHSGRVHSPAFSSDARQALTAGEEGTVRVWDVTSSKLLRVFHVNNQQPGIHCGATVAAWSSDGKWIAAGGYERPTRGAFRGSCRIWDAATGKEFCANYFPHRVSHLAFAPDGKSLAIATLDYGPDRMKNTIYVLDFLNGRELITVSERPELILGLAFSPNGKSLVSVEPHFLRLWDIVTKKQTTEFDLPARTNSASFSPNGKAVVSDDWDGGRLFIMGVGSGRLARAFKAPETYGSIAALSPDGRIMASCQRTIYSPDREYDYVIRLWEIATGKEIRQVHPDSTVFSLAFARDGLSLISGMNNGTTLIWNMKSKLGTNHLSQNLESLFSDLADENVGKAHKAIWAFVAAPNQSVPFLRDRLKPVVLADQAQIQKWIVDLDSVKFDNRQAAKKALEKIGQQVEPSIHKALKSNVTLETRRRLEQILNTLADVLGLETLRTIRAIMALERIGTPEAQSVLETLANGAPGARETEEAKASLERLKHRAPNVP